MTSSIPSREDKWIRIIKKKKLKDSKKEKETMRDKNKQRPGKGKKYKLIDPIYKL